MQYIIYCDESEKKGEFFGNFYGGALIRSNHLDNTVDKLNMKKDSLGFKGEIKWQKVTDQYLEKYIDLVDYFFEFIKEDIVKLRIMFTQNYFKASNLTKEQRDNEFFLLYYQFLKHAFGLKYSNLSTDTISLKIFFDKLPDTKEANRNFKDYIYKLQQVEQFQEANLVIKKDHIIEAISHDHVILQCMDIILGGMHFRLNNLHLKKPEGSNRRGKRTIAKEKLYKRINAHIREIYPGFNIGSSTGISAIVENYWLHPYRHWLFKATDYVIDTSRSKGYAKK